MINPQRPDFENTPVSPQRPEYRYRPAGETPAPLVSIVTPYYNTGAIFHETARSVLQQSFQHWEWLIANDGSTVPEALEVLDHYRSLDPRIRVIDLPRNMGTSAAKNWAIREARTDLIVLLDSDDLLEPTTLEKWFWFLLSYPEWYFVQGWTVAFGANNYLWHRGFCSGREILQENVVDYASMLRREVFEKTGGFNEDMRTGLEDWDLWCKLANAGFWGQTIPEYFKWYRTRENHSEKWEAWQPKRLAEFREVLKERYPRLYEGYFPEIDPVESAENEPIPEEIPCENALAKDRKRLLLLIPWMVTGGADKFNIELVKYLTGQGWDVSVVTTKPSENEWAYEYGRYTGDIFSLPNFLRLRDYPRFLRYFIQSRRFDAVMITNCELGYLLLPFIRAQFPDLPVLDFNHAEAEDWKSGGYPRLTLTFQHYLDTIGVSSLYLKDWLVERGADARKIETCYVNVDTDLFAPSPENRRRVRAGMGLAEDLPVILYAARIDIEKQPRVFARVIQRVAASHDRFHVLVAGDGPDLPWLRSFVQENGLEERVSLLGAVPRPRMVELMQASDILFLPSLREGIALVLFEAMASGMCVVGADVGGQKELVTPECGYLVCRSDDPEEEVERYAAVLEDLLANPERIATMGRAGRERVVENFRLEDMGRRMCEILDHTIQVHHRRHPSFYSVDGGWSAAAMAMETIRLQLELIEGWRYRVELENALQAAQAQTAAFPAHFTPVETLRIRQLVYHLFRKSFFPYYNRMGLSGSDRILRIKERVKKVFDL